MIRVHGVSQAGGIPGNAPAKKVKTWQKALGLFLFLVSSIYNE